MLPLSAPGAGVSLFRYLQQKVPGSGLPGLCRSGVPCSREYINRLEFITLLLTGAARANRR